MVQCVYYSNTFCISLIDGTRLARYFGGSATNFLAYGVSNDIGIWMWFCNNFYSFEGIKKQTERYTDILLL